MHASTLPTARCHALRLIPRLTRNSVGSGITAGTSIVTPAGTSSGVTPSTVTNARPSGVRPTTRSGTTTSAPGPPTGACLLYTADAADDLLCVDLGGRRIIT